MTKQELEAAKDPAAVGRLLERVEHTLVHDYERTAFNFLVDYYEDSESLDGRTLVLCLEVLNARIDSD